MTGLGKSAWAFHNSLAVRQHVDKGEKAIRNQKHLLWLLHGTYLSTKIMFHTSHCSTRDDTSRWGVLSAFLRHAFQLKARERQPITQPCARVQCCTKHYELLTLLPSPKQGEAGLASEVLWVSCVMHRSNTPRSALLWCPAPVCCSLNALLEQLPPAIHSCSSQKCHDNFHVTGCKHTTSLQGFALGRLGLILLTLFYYYYSFFPPKPRFGDTLFRTRCIEPTSRFYRVAANIFS